MILNLKLPQNGCPHGMIEPILLENPNKGCLKYEFQLQTAPATPKKEVEPSAKYWSAPPTSCPTQKCPKITKTWSSKHLLREALYCWKANGKEISKSTKTF